MATTKKIFISAGEASGDLHASNLVIAVHQLQPQMQFYGMGGKLMQQSGVEIIVNSNELSIVGAIEVITHSRQIWAAMRKIKKFLKIQRPDLIILIDFPGFNLWLAKVAKKAGIKVLYYISPQIWAWHQSRLKTISQYVDMMAVVFPFEIKFYQDAQIPVVCVEHPLVNIVKPSMPINVAKQNFHLDLGAKTIGLLPGSRKGEIQRLLPIILDAAALLHKNQPHLQFVLPLASSLTAKDIEPYLQNHPELPIKIIHNDNYNAMHICDAIIATSGTVTLEITLLAIPMVIIYKMAPVNYFLAKRLIKIPYIGLCNIIANNKIVQELIQHEANAENINAEIQRILNDEAYRSTMITKLIQVKQSLEGSSVEQPKRLIEQVVVDML
jgi:lipid-A-disaccharide synthase